MEGAPSFQFTYAGIVDEEFAFLQQHFELGKEPAGRLGLAFTVEAEDRNVFCRANTELSIDDGPAFVVCAVTCGFRLTEASWDERLVPAEGVIKLEKPMLDHFGAFTVGALRGYLHARLSRTPARALLPAIDVARLLEGVPTEYPV